MSNVEQANVECRREYSPFSIRHSTFACSTFDILDFCPVCVTYPAGAALPAFSAYPANFPQVITCRPPITLPSPLGLRYWLMDPARAQPRWRGGWSIQRGAR